MQMRRTKNKSKYVTRHITIQLHSKLNKNHLFGSKHSYNFLLCDNNLLFLSELHYIKCARLPRILIRFLLFLFSCQPILLHFEQERYFGPETDQSAKRKEGSVLKTKTKNENRNKKIFLVFSIIGC